MAGFSPMVRKLGALATDYSIPFRADFLPREGDYFSIRRPRPTIVPISAW